jgi:hypothetical protein
LLPGALFKGDDMVCYIKEFGRHGADPAKIFVDKNGNIAEWKSVERQNQNGTSYKEEYGVFKIHISIPAGKDANGRMQYKNSNSIWIKIKNKAIFDYLTSMEQDNVKYYWFYGAIACTGYNTQLVNKNTQNGTIQVPCTEIEYCELNDCDFRILLVFNQTQSAQSAPQSKPCEVSNDYVDDDIPF